MKYILIYYILCYCIFCIEKTTNVSAQSCPNNCNKNGICTNRGRCQCTEGYKGADCSLRVCPFGTAWSDFAYGKDAAHGIAECSNRGQCSRDTGICTCMDGFTGPACERLTCSGNCNGAGKCLSMRNYALATSGMTLVNGTYTTNWDVDKIYGCMCDSYHEGYDCSLKSCPRGDDPLTTMQVNEVQLLKCAAIGGTFSLSYNGASTKPIPFDSSASTVQEALLTIKAITGVTVKFSIPTGVVCQPAANIVQIEFLQQFGPLNPLVADGSSLGRGGVITVSADGQSGYTDSVGQTFVSIKGTKESDTCSNRGLCTASDGTCACFNTNGDAYDSSDGYGLAGTRGDCGYIKSGTSVSTCPGSTQCSGHGFCNTGTFRCSCSSGWTGGDCSQKVCPTGRSWFDIPSGPNTAHKTWATCSNMGLCDSASGKCTCRLDFFGQACEYMGCGGGTSTPCNGHGRCMSMTELALWSQVNGDSAGLTYGTDPNNQFTWDGSRIYGCMCDSGYSGYDCSEKVCPSGDDPVTYDQNDEIQVLQCFADSGTFKLKFRQMTTGPIPANASSLFLQNALSSLSTTGGPTRVFYIDDAVGVQIANTIKTSAYNLADIFRKTPIKGAATSASLPDKILSITKSANTYLTPACTNSGQTIIIVFDSAHGALPALTTDITNLRSTQSTPFIDVNWGGTKDALALAGSAKTLIAATGTTENEVCNNHGLCDVGTGKCSCFSDWTSSDGMGGLGVKNDCGYRKVDISYQQY